MVSSWLGQSPSAVAAQLRTAGIERAWIARDPETSRLRASHAVLAPVADALADGGLDYHEHEALFLAPSPRGHELFGAFLHSTRRGQAQGGLRHCPYETLEAFLRDGLRLSLGTARGSALAGLWWGGGKGLIARCPGDEWRQPHHRRSLYSAYGRFVSALRGCYVAAADAGTGPVDMAEVAVNTRFASCTPPRSGGSGNPSSMTALGVVEALEAALDHLGSRPLATQRVAMQGAGRVGAPMLERLLEKGVTSIVVSDVSNERCEELRRFFAGRPVEVRLARAGDEAILAEDCDVLLLNALGGVLSATTTPTIRARVICGAANNPLAREVRDADALHRRGVLYVPDYVANCMGTVASCNEQAGTLPADPAVLTRLDRGDPGSIYQITRGILEQAAAREQSPVHAANEVADRAIPQLHPIHGDRAQQIIHSLIEDAWPAEGAFGGDERLAAAGG